MKIKLETRCKGRIMALALYFWKKLADILYVIEHRIKRKKEEIKKDVIAKSKDNKCLISSRAAIIWWNLKDSVIA